jgi:UTP--glucose-1-phosphate uridylyltransferase
MNVKAVIPAAGYGTRFLPVTKSVPKELLPILDTPVIHMVMAEARNAGFNQIAIIISPGKEMLKRYFAPSPELLKAAKQKCNREPLENLQSVDLLPRPEFIMQKEPRGLGDALLCASRFVGNRPVAMLLADTIIQATPPCIAQLLKIFRQRRKSILAVEEVSNEELGKYGIIAGRPIARALYQVLDIVEKPTAKIAPSCLAIASRYILTPAIFGHLRALRDRVDEELLMTAALQQLAKNEGLLAYRFHGTRYDIGSPSGFLKANLDFASHSASLRKELLAYLESKHLV